MRKHQLDNILIVGCGYVGQALAKSFLQSGTNIWALQRNPIALSGVENMLIDINDLGEDVLPKVQTIFYLVSSDQYTESAYKAAYINGISRLLSVVKNKEETKIIYVSSTAVYGQENGEWVDELSPTHPSDFSGKILLEGESLVRSSSFRHSIIRFAGIYGPTRHKMVDAILNHQARKIPRSVYTNRIHLQDCVGILQHAANAKGSDTYLGVDSEPILYNDFIDEIAKKKGLEIPMGDVVPLRLMKSNKRCSNQKLLNEGYQFYYPTFREGYAQFL